MRKKDIELLVPGSVWASKYEFDRLVRVVSVHGGRIQWKWTKGATNIHSGSIDEFLDGRFVALESRSAADFRRHLEIKTSEGLAGWNQPIGWLALAGLHIAESITELGYAVRKAR